MKNTVQHMMNASPRVLPLWSVSDKEPRAVRIPRRICWVWAAFAIAGLQYGLMAHMFDETGAPPDAMMTNIRLVGGALLCLVAAVPYRHIALYIARWVLPVAYLVVLPSFRWFVLLPVMVLLVPYVRHMSTLGVLAWFQRPTSIKKAFKSTEI